MMIPIIAAATNTCTRAWPLWSTNLPPKQFMGLALVFKSGTVVFMYFTSTDSKNYGKPRFFDTSKKLRAQFRDTD
jgi:hypothetical protein